MYLLICGALSGTRRWAGAILARPFCKAAGYGVRRGLGLPMGSISGLETSRMQLFAVVLAINRCQNRADRIAWLFVCGHRLAPLCFF